MNVHPTPSQAAIGRALGISPASMTKCKAMGMPTDSVDAARAWRQSHIKPTAHGMLAAPHSPKPTLALQPSAAMAQALAMLEIASSTLEAGQSIAAMVPALRASLRAVPDHERDGSMLLPVEVMNVLVADVLKATIELDESADRCAETTVPMSDEDAAWMGHFWFQVAAGEIRPASC